MRTGAYEPIGSTITAVQGVSAGGGYVTEARYEYEVCYRCHGDSAVQVKRNVGRQAEQPNLRLSFSPANPSYHPVVVAAQNHDTVSLVPELAIGSMIRCTDCHNNDAGPRAGGAGPDGPHGSNYDFLLERNYTVRDDTPESQYEYALCYKCHQRASILSDQSFPKHRLHIVDQRTPCSACHDPHGVSRTVAIGSDHTHLINFDTVVVRPTPTTARLEFRDLGRFQGSCTLLCHGVVHNELSYSR
jgi:hypothetical protein